MDELIVSIISNAPSVGIMAWLIYRQEGLISRLTDALIRRENCDDAEADKPNT